MKQVSGQMSLFDLDMPCGRMSPEHSAATKEKTSALSSKSSAKSKTPTPLYLDLRRGGVSGLLAEPSWETGIPSHGASSMHAFGEFPNVAEESGLWQILEVNVPQKYYLSARACAGVLRRAERRGKELPTILKTALEQQIERWGKYGSPLPVFEGEGVIAECYDARGNGEGNVVPTITRDHEDRITDNTSVVIAIDRAAFNQGKNAKYDFDVDERGTAQTVVARGPGGVCYGFHPWNSVTAAVNINEEFSPTLEVKKEAGVCYCIGNGQVAQLSLSKEARRLDCMHDKQAVLLGTSPIYTVRRLTPLECCRLQGFPDDWVADVPHSDAQEYKMWGNGMALPNALYIMEGLAKSEE